MSPKHKTNKRTKRGPASSRGIRGERLSGDGKTFTTLMSLPKSVTPLPKEYSMVQEITISAAFVSSVSVPSFGSQQFNFAQVDQFSSLQTIFDQYMIPSVEIWLMPQQSAAAGSIYGGLLKSVIDLDDATALTTLAQFGDYTSCVTSEPTQGHYRNFVPHVALAAYSGLFNSFANRSRQWIDTSSASVQHYGLKYGVSATTSAVTYDLLIKLHLKFRSVR